MVFVTFLKHRFSTFIIKIISVNTSFTKFVVTLFNTSSHIFRKNIFFANSYKFHKIIKIIFSLINRVSPIFRAVHPDMHNGRMTIRKPLVFLMFTSDSQSEYETFTNQSYNNAETTNNIFIT